MLFTTDLFIQAPNRKYPGESKVFVFQLHSIFNLHEDFIYLFLTILLNIKDKSLSSKIIY